VPNVLNALLASVGLALAVTGWSGISVGAALAGLGVGLALMLPGFVFGAMGAGDVKLFAAMGTLVGPSHILRAFVFTAIAGGILAVASRRCEVGCNRRSPAPARWSRAAAPTRRRSRRRVKTTGFRTRRPSPSAASSPPSDCEVPVKDVTSSERPAVTTFSRRVRRLLSGERGTALIETAMTLPLLLLVSVGIFEFGRAFQTWQILTNAAREARGWR